MTISQKVFDNLLKHQIYASRLSRSESQQIFDILDKYNENISSKINKIKTFSQRKDFYSMMREIKAVDDDLFEDIVEQMGINLNQYYKQEKLFMKDLYNKSISKSLPKVDFDVMDADVGNELSLDKIKVGKKGQKKGNKLYIEGTSVTDLLNNTKQKGYNDLYQKLEYAFLTNGDFDEIYKEYVDKQNQYLFNIYISSSAVVRSQAEEDFYQENADSFDEYGTYVAVLDSHTTPICMSLHGNVYRVDEGPRPPQHYGCRSEFILNLDLEQLDYLYPYSVIKEAIGQVKVYKNFDEFLRNQNKEFIEEILGIKKAKLFMNNRLELKKFIDEGKNRFFTLDEMRKKHKEIFDSL